MAPPTHSLPRLHATLNAQELASLIDVPVDALGKDKALQSSSNWIALVDLTAFKDSPSNASIPLPVNPKKSSWWRINPQPIKPATQWLVAAEVDPGSWIWLGDASCHSWGIGSDGQPVSADLVLEHRIPHASFLQIRQGDPWISLGGGLDLSGSGNNLSAQRLRTIASTPSGDVFLARWEGEHFCLQFNETHSVFYVLAEGAESPSPLYALSPATESAPVSQSDCLLMHCTCCGIDVSDLSPEVHMPRNFGFFILSWLIDHNDLPKSCPWLPEGQNAIQWMNG